MIFFLYFWIDFLRLLRVRKYNCFFKILNNITKKILFE